LSSLAIVEKAARPFIFMRLPRSPDQFEGSVVRRQFTTWRSAVI